MRVSRRLLTLSVLPALALVLAMPAHAQSRATGPTVHQDTVSGRQDKAQTSVRAEPKADVVKDVQAPKADGKSGQSGKAADGDQKAQGEKKTDRVHPERELEEEEDI